MTKSKNPIHCISIKTLLATTAGFVIIFFLLPFMFIVSNQHNDIYLLKKEQVGAELIPELQKANIFLAQHRGTTNRFLNGNRDLIPVLEALDDQIDRVFSSNLTSCESLYIEAKLPCNRLRELKNQWSNLKMTYLSLPISESFSQHSVLISNMLAFLIDVSDESNLSLDNQLSNYYLMNNMVQTMPLLIEQLGKLRGFGSGLMVKTHQINATEQTEIIKLSHGVSFSLELLNVQLEKLFVAFPSFGEQSHKKLETAKLKIEKFLVTVDSHIIQKNSGISDEQFYVQATDVIAQLMTLYNSIVDVLHQELKKRSVELVSKQYCIFASAFVLFMTLISVLCYLRKRLSILGEAIICFEQIGTKNYDYPITIKYNDEIGQLLLALIVMRDRLVDNVEQIERLAFYDGLTGLMNRRIFETSVKQALTEIQRNQKSLALLFIDLDGFKAINDNFGHDVGDAVLVTTADRLKEHVRESDLVSRFGGDEFVVALTLLNDANDIVLIAEKLVKVLNQTRHDGSKTFSITPSIGISVYSETCNDYEKLLVSADNAMYLAKKSGKNNYKFAENAD